MTRVLHPPDPPDWVALVDEPLPVEVALRWVTIPTAGAVVHFCGTVRDHSPGRTGVWAITYEAYEGPAHAALVRLAAEARGHWSDLGRIVLWHRIGDVPLGEASVAVVVSAGHRGPAFEATRFLIDALKERVPIWKLEHWSGGAGWATDARMIRPTGDPPGPAPAVTAGRD